MSVDRSADQYIHVTDNRTNTAHLRGCGIGTHFPLARSTGTPAVRSRRRTDGEISIACTRPCSFSVTRTGAHGSIDLYRQSRQIQSVDRLISDANYSTEIDHSWKGQGQVTAIVITP